MRILLLSAVLLTGGCTNLAALRDPKNFVATDEDFSDIAKTCLDIVERTSPVTTIVLPANVDRRVRATMMKLRHVATEDSIPRSAEFTLPENWFVLQTFTIADGEATLEGQLGPVRRVPVPPAIGDCGKNFQFQYFLDRSGWYSQSYKTSICSESRHWVPKDDAPESQGN